MRRINTPAPRNFSVRVSFLLCCCLLLAAVLRTEVSTDAKREAPAPGAGSSKAARRAAPQTNRHVVGEWSPQLIPLNNVPVHMSLLPNGKLLYWGRDKDGSPQQWDRAGSCMTYLWEYKKENPTAGLTMEIPNTTTNLFCSGHSFLPDGRLFVAGGHDRYSERPDVEGIGEREVNIFDHVRSMWTLGEQKMAKGRWYPFNVTMANGETAIFSGRYWDGASVVWHTGTNRYIPKTELNIHPEIYTREGKLRGFPNASITNPPSPSPPSIPMYPYLHLAPNGKVFVAGTVHETDPRNWYFDPDGNGGQGTFSQTPVNSSTWVHNYGSSVLYDSVNGKVMNSGGNYTPTANQHQISVIDLTNAPEWRYPAPMNHGRKYHTSTLLPDGKVLVTGGTRCAGGNNIDCPEGAATHPELWDPNAETWAVMAPNPSGIPRVYHSVALLLPDARVLVAGGGLPAAAGERPTPTSPPCENVLSYFNRVECMNYGHRDAEVFSPPYLFDSEGNEAPRPVIQTAPAEVSYNTRFSITFGNAAGLQKVTWIRLPSVTHGFNQDQRIVVFDADDITVNPTNPNKLSIKAPPPNQCPPGHYMMFAISQSGVPSEARIIRISNDPTNVSSRVARDLRGRLKVFYRGSEWPNSLYYFAQTGDGPDGPWSSPVPLGGGLASDPVAVANADGRIQVFAAITGDGQIYSRKEIDPDAGTWSNWEAIPSKDLLGGEKFVSEPVAVRNWDGVIQLFARTSPGNHIYYTVQVSPNGAFDQWRPLGGSAILPPSAGVNRDGRVQLFILGSDNGVHYRTQTSPGSAHTWTEWATLPSTQTPCNPSCQFAAVSKPTVARNDDGRLEVYARGLDNQIYVAWQTAPDAHASWVWSWQPTGLLAANYPSVARDAEGRLQIFVRGQPDGDVRFRRQLSANGSGLLESAVSLGGVAATPPHVIRRADGRLEAFVRGTDNQLYRKWQITAGGGQWSDWHALGGSAANF